MKDRKKGANVKHETKTAAKADMNATPAQTAPESPPMVIKVLKRDAKYRGARDKWYARLLEHDGKTLDEYVESCKKNCPQLTKNNTAEPPMGWVSFFRREGVMEVKPAVA